MSSSSKKCNDSSGTNFKVDDCCQPKNTSVNNSCELSAEGNCNSSKTAKENNSQEKRSKKNDFQLERPENERLDEFSSSQDNEKLRSISSNTVYRHFQCTSIFSLTHTLISNIYFALCMNIILLFYEDFYLYQGFILPYMIIAVMKRFLEPQTNEHQKSSTLAAVIILCNVKPEIVHILKKISRECCQMMKNFSLYFISLVYFNWIISTLVNKVHNITIV